MTSTRGSTLIFERNELCFFKDIPCSFRSRLVLLNLDKNEFFESGCVRPRELSNCFRIFFSLPLIMKLTE